MKNVKDIFNALLEGKRIRKKEWTDECFLRINEAGLLVDETTLIFTEEINIIPKDFYRNVFTGNIILDPILGSIFGSIAAGNPVTSYVIGGELLEQGVSLLAVTGFIIAWVTVGIVQLPAEAYLLGTRFAVFRNLISFVFSILIAILMVLTLKVL